jgi:tetratricopeptide (TPR) repeat protein
MTRIIRKPSGRAILLIMFAPILLCMAGGLLAKKRPDSPPVAPPETAANAPAGSMTAGRARRTVFTGLQASNVPASNIGVRTGSIEFDANGEGFYLPNGHYILDLKTLGRVTVAEHVTHHGTHYYHLVFNGSDPNARGRVNPAAKPDRSWPEAINLLACLWWHPADDPQAFAKAQAFADALNRLSASARGEPDDDPAWRDFPQKAAAWRALTVKPPISEEVREHRILAENAFREKNLYAAIDEYEAGLALNPAWPEGHFNAALLCAELRFYDDAIQHMRAYIELVPDAPDAQSARDQIVIWRSKLK